MSNIGLIAMWISALVLLAVDPIAGAFATAFVFAFTLLSIIRNEDD